MPAQIDLENDAANPITSYNYGSIGGGISEARKFIAANSGNTDAASLSLFINRIAQNDGVDFVQIAPDVAGNPGAFSSAALVVGALAAGASVPFWVQVTVPVGTSPFGNPRQFNVIAEYTGT